MTDVQAQTQTGIPRNLRALLLGFLSAAVIAVILFVSSGDMRWAMAWVYVGLMALSFVINSRLVDEELIEERTHTKHDTRSWDRLLLILLRLTMGFVLLIVAGLDRRFGWTQPVLSLVIQIIGLGLFVLGHSLLSWSMASNKFFSDVIRIQSERGHTVATRGPYRYLRHPGYAGGIMEAVGVPLMFGSVWALIPGAVAAIIIVTRTALEDQVLQNELDGYRDYTQRVRYRLLPGVW